MRDLKQTDSIFYETKSGKEINFLAAYAFQHIKNLFYIIFASSGTISSDTMLMILIIGLTAGPAVSL